MYKPHWPKARSYDAPSFPANHQSFLKALYQEKRMFECGYFPGIVPIVNKKGDVVKVTRWVYNPEKAHVFLENSKVVKKLEIEKEMVMIH